jgi:hypothetical protein
VELLLSIFAINERNQGLNTYLRDVLHLGKLEGDAQAGDERREMGAGASKWRDLQVCGLRIHGGRELLEGLRYFPQRLLVVLACHRNEISLALSPSILVLGIGTFFAAQR